MRFDSGSEVLFTDAQLQRGVVHADIQNGVGEIDILGFGLGPPPHPEANETFGPD